MFFLRVVKKSVCMSERLTQPVEDGQRCSKVSAEARMMKTRERTHGVVVP